MNSNSVPFPPAPLSGHVRVISCGWGTEYIFDFLEYCLPALLSPGNLPAMCAVFQCELVYLTEESTFDVVAEHPNWRKATRLCPARLIALDDLLIGPDSYGVTLTHVLHRGFSDQGPAMTSNWQIFFNSDFIVADGGLKRVALEMLAGHRLIVAPSYCVSSDTAKAILDDARNPETGAITISNRAMAAMILRHRHATVRGKTVNQPLFSFLYNDQFYWLVDDYTLVGHQMPIAMIAMMPLVYLPKPTTYWDYGIVQDFLPNVAPLVLSDSDDFVMAELRAKSTSENDLRLGPRTLHEMAMSLQGFATPETTKMAAYQLMLHSREQPAGLANAKAKLAEVVREVIVQAGTLPHHQKHFQWLDHQARLHDYWARNKKLAPGAKQSASIEPAVRKFAPCGEASTDTSRVAVGAAAEIAQRQRSEGQHPFRSINETEITEATQRLLDSIVVSSPLTEANAVELTVSFTHVLDLLLQKRLFTAQEAYRSAARDAVLTLIANPSVAAQNAETSSVIGSLRITVSTISAYDRSFDQIFSEPTTRPLMTWIQTLWTNVVSLRDIIAQTSKQSFTSLEAEAPAAKARISDLLAAFQDFFPFEHSRQVYEPAITGVVQEAASSEAIDMHALGWLFVRVATSAFDRTSVDQLSGMKINQDAEHIVLRRIFETIPPLVEQVLQFGHLFHDFKNRVDHNLMEFKDRIHGLSLEAANTLSSVEKFTRIVRDDAISEEGILGVPLGGTKSPAYAARLFRFLKRQMRWLHHLPGSEVPFSKFVSDHGSFADKAILHIDSGSSFTRCYTEFANVRYWLPLSLVQTLLVLNIEPVHTGCFDLCIVDIDDGDPSAFSVVYQVIERAMRTGSAVILLARRPRGLELRRDDPRFIRGMFPGSGYARIWYTNSVAARLATNIVESARVLCRQKNLPQFIARPIMAAALFMAAPLALGAVCIEYCRKWPQTAKVPVKTISVTLEVSVPNRD